MRVILINPYVRKIEEIIVKKNDISSIYHAMSWLGHKVSIVQVGMCLANSDNLLVDEEGMLHPDRPVWKLGGNPFVGCGLLLGADPKDSEWTHVKTDIRDIKDYVSWTMIVSTGVSL